MVESGFAYAGPLLKLLGVDLQALGFKEEAGFRNMDKIRHWAKPFPIIHAEFDQIRPFAEGQALYDSSPSSESLTQGCRRQSQRYPVGRLCRIYGSSGAPIVRVTFELPGL